MGVKLHEKAAPVRRIAAEVEQAANRRVLLGEPGGNTSIALARGEGWSVYDVLCTFGPQDQPFEEQHTGHSITVVIGGTFQYRSANTKALLAPGSMLLGNDGRAFECGHEHAAGDRCIAFKFAPDYFERIAADVRVEPHFRDLVLPPLRAFAALTTNATLGVLDHRISWDELSVDLAAAALRGANAPARPVEALSRSAERRVTEGIRNIERNPAAPHTLDALAAQAELSPYYYLRTFRQLTGVTPHQFILRTRLREAATRIALEPGRIIDIAFAGGFGDLANFNHAFRAEFGMSPRNYRAREDGASSKQALKNSV